MVNSPADVVGAVSSDRRFAGYRVRRQGLGWVELEGAGQRTPAVFVVLAWPELWQDANAFRPHLIRARSGNYGLVLVGAAGELESAGLEARCGDADFSTLALPVAMGQLVLHLRNRANAMAMQLAAAALELELERSRHDNDMLISVGRALSQERDIESLLAMILRHAREVTNADAGSIYIVEGHDEDIAKRRLRFAVSQNESRDVQASGFTMPVTAASIVGACAMTGQRVNVPDLYRLDKPGVGNNPWRLVHDRTFDDKYHYQGRSVLAVPMISARDQVIGVIQLINRRAKGYLTLDTPSDFETGVVPFDPVAETCVAALASQAGIALENVLLYREVTTLFDGFVQAAVTAIESRDPTTSGHSNRVAALTVGLGRAVTRSDRGRYRELQFSDDELKQIEYAALLHDFGKVGVREHILVKAKKLYEHERQLILQRFELIKRGRTIAGLEAKLVRHQTMLRADVERELVTIDDDVNAKLAELDDIVRFILSANEPTVLEQGGFERIADIAAMAYQDGDATLPFLTSDEAACLQIRRGSLSEAERLEINSHVVHTYNFLRQIPWSRSLRGVAEIAGAHHEKLDGSGYPHGLRGDQIPVPARMMAIADIFDALTASDRPYKKAMPTDKALDILASDVARGSLDAELFDIFVGASVYALTAAK